MPGRRTPRPLAERFWEKVDKSAGPDKCWPWTASRFPNGYGRVMMPHGNESAHRVAYALTYGPIPDGKVVDHVKARGCGGGPCVNPVHLEAVTQRTNILRGDGLTARNARKTHCINGHPFTADNLLPRKDGRRYCRTCQSKYSREAYKRRTSRLQEAA